MAFKKTLANLSVRFLGDTKSYENATKRVRKNNSAIAKSFKRIAAFAVASLSIQAVRGFIKESKEAYTIQQESEKKLQTVMEQRMNATYAQIESIKELAKEQQDLGVIGDEVFLAGAQQVATFLRQKESIDKLLPAMGNLLAQQKGYKATAMDAVNVANMMGKVLDGQVGALKRVGISFSEAQLKILKTGTEMERTSTLAEVITDNVGEMNAALRNTPLGEMNAFTMGFEDMTEKVGELFTLLSQNLIPTLNDGISDSTTLLTALNNLVESKPLEKVGKSDALKKVWDVYKWTNPLIAWNKLLLKGKNLIVGVAEEYNEATDEAKKLANIDIVPNSVGADPIKEILPLIAQYNKDLKDQRDIVDAALPGQERSIAIANRQIQLIQEKIKALRELGRIPPPPSAVTTDAFEGYDFGGGDLEGFEIDIIPDNEVMDKVELISTAMTRLRDSTAELSSQTTDYVTDMVGAISESFGAMVAGTGNFEDFFKNVLSLTADFIGQFGKLLITAGIGKIAFDKIAVFGGGPGMIAAGALMMAAAGAIKGHLSSQGGGGAGYSAAANTINNNTTNYNNRETMQIEIVGETVVKGDDVYFVWRERDRFYNENT